MKNIPLIIPVFNQLTYLRNLINWWRWYHPENPICVVNNGSTYKPLLDYLRDGDAYEFDVYHYEENNFIPNVRDFIKDISERHEYYAISDPDIMPHPNTPMNFLEIFRDAIDNKHFHRAGFNLVTNDLPDYLNEKAMIEANEKELLNNMVMNFGKHIGYKAPIDTTFCLYTSKNSGWQAPMDGKDWGNCLRLFEAFHLGWYVDGDNLNHEMKNYFETSKYRVPGEPSAGKNNNRPKQYQ